MGSVGTLASAAGRPGRAQEGTEGGSEAALPAFPCPEAVFQTRVALEETHLMVQGRCSSPPLPGRLEQGQPVLRPCLPRYRASLPCLPLPASPHSPRPIHSASLEFTEQPALESVSSELGSAWPVPACRVALGRVWRGSEGRLAGPRASASASRLLWHPRLS